MRTVHVRPTLTSLEKRFLTRLINFEERKVILLALADVKRREGFTDAELAIANDMHEKIIAAIDEIEFYTPPRQRSDE